MLHHPSRIGFLLGASQQYAVQMFDGCLPCPRHLDRTYSIGNVADHLQTAFSAFVGNREIRLSRQLRRRSLMYERPIAARRATSARA